MPVFGPQGETQEAVRATYAILATLPADERLAFSLRFVSELQLTEVAAPARCRWRPSSGGCCGPSSASSPRRAPARRCATGWNAANAGVRGRDAVSNDGNSGLPGLMKDVARAVRAEAERRQLLPRVESATGGAREARPTRARTR